MSAAFDVRTIVNNRRCLGCPSVVGGTCTKAAALLTMSASLQEAHSSTPTLHVKRRKELGVSIRDWLPVSPTVREAYLQEACKADEKAEHSMDPGTADIWRRVADSYRALAADLEQVRKLDWH